MVFGRGEGQRAACPGGFSGYSSRRLQSHKRILSASETKAGGQLSPGGVKRHTHQEDHDARSFYELQGCETVRFDISPPVESAPDVEYHWRL